MGQPSWRVELSQLLMRALEEDLKDAERMRLNDILKTHRQARQYYVEFMTLCSHLRQHRPFRGLEIGPEQVASAPSDIVSEALDRDEQAIAEEARREAVIREREIEKAAEVSLMRFREQERRRLDELARRRYLARRRQLTVMTAAALVLLVVAGWAWLAGWMGGRVEPMPSPSVPPISTPPVVARITRSLNGQWLRKDFSMEPGTLLTASSLSLTHGLVEMAFEGGAQVILQAPAALQLEAPDRLFLKEGSVAVKLAGDSRGFVVRTPTGTVVDRGTEFGVLVRTGGGTEAHVFQGEVSLHSGSDVASGGGKVLRAAQAGTVDEKGEVAETGFRPDLVFRAMPDRAGFAIPGQRLSLTDIVFGGNGFGTAPEGRMCDMRRAFVSEVDYAAQIRNTEVRLRVVQASDGIDCLFVPDGSSGSFQVTSAGHHFAGFPDTDGSYRAVIADSGFLRDHGRGPEPIAPMVLGGRTYGTAAHPGLAMHANRGITFDLDTIRSALAGMRIDRFSMLCGISGSVRDTSASGNRTSGQADIWVLIDGQVRFSRKKMRVESGPVPVDIPCSDTDRFLSLAVTDGGNGSNFDWAVFAEPALELVSKGDNATQTPNSK